MDYFSSGHIRAGGRMNCRYSSNVLFCTICGKVEEALHKNASGDICKGKISVSNMEPHRNEKRSTNLGGYGGSPSNER